MCLIQYHNKEKKRKEKERKGKVEEEEDRVVDIKTRGKTIKQVEGTQHSRSVKTIGRSVSRSE